MPDELDLPEIKTDPLVIPFYNPLEMTEEVYLKTYLFENPMLIDLLWTNASLLRKMKEVIDRHIRDYHYSVYDVFIPINIVIYNRFLRSRDTTKLIGFITSKIEEIEIFEGLDKYQQISTVSASKVNRSTSLESLFKPLSQKYESYTSYLIGSIHAEKTREVTKSDIQKDAWTLKMNESLERLVEQPEKIRDQALFENNWRTVEDNKIQENLEFLGPNHFQLLAVDMTLDRFVLLVNKYQRWIYDFYGDIVYGETHFDREIDLCRPFSDYQKYLVTRSFSLLVWMEYNTLFNDTYQFNENINIDFLREWLRNTWVLTEAWLDFNKMEQILAGYE